ncbi:MAG: efflux RND transporter permease subunit [Leptospiraceae bacterium]|nr:efflux RND transporter permease subunit [Leptospiraceae bacterium]
MKEWIQRNSLRSKIIYYTFLILIVLSYDTIRFGDNKKDLNNSFSIEFRYPNANIESLTEKIVIPVEEKLSAISGIKSIFSRIENGRAFLFLETNLEPRIQKEIRGILETEYSKFPTDASRPILEKSSIDEKPDIIYSIEMNQIRIHEAIHQIKALKGIKRVIVYGEEKKEIQIDCDHKTLSNRKISLERIQSLIHDNNTERVIKRVSIGNKVSKISLKTTLHSFHSISELEIEPKIKLKNFCRVFEAIAKQNSATRKNLKEKVSVYIFLEDTDKKFKIDEILKIFDKERINFEEIFNESKETNKSLINLFLSLLIILILRLFIRNFHRIKIISLEEEIFILFNNLLIFVIFLGVLSRKVTEFNLLIVQANYLLNSKEQPMKSLFGSGLLLLFLGMGTLDSEIVMNLFLFFSLNITTIFYYYFYEFHVKKLFLGRIFNYTIIKIIRNTILSYIKLLEKIQTNHLIRKIIEKIKIISQKILKSEIIKFSIMSLVILSGITILSKSYIAESRFMNINTVWGTLEMGTGTGFMETDSSSRKIEGEFLNFTEVRNVFAKIEKDQAKYQLELKPEIEFTKELEAKLKELGSSIEDGFLYFQTNRDRSDNEIEFWVSGDEWNRLDQYCKKIISKIKKHPKVKDAFLKYKSPKRDLELKIDSGKVNQMGINVSGIANKIRNYNSGSVIGKIFDGKEILDVWLKGKNLSKKNLYDTEIQIADSKLKLKAFSDENEIHKADKIYRKNREMILPFLVVLENPSFRDEIILSIFEEELEEGYRIHVEKIDHKSSTKEKFLLSFAISIIGIFIILEKSFWRIIFSYIFLVMLGIVSVHIFDSLDFEILILILVISNNKISNMILEDEEIT